MKLSLDSNVFIYCLASSILSHINMILIKNWFQTRTSTRRIPRVDVCLVHRTEKMGEAKLMELPPVANPHLLDSNTDQDV